MAKIEYYYQMAVVNYLRLRYRDVLFTISPQGMKLPVSTAKQFKIMGYNAGTPDIMIFEARHGYHGLFIEIKTPEGPGIKKGVISPAQKEWIAKLNERGYKAIICFGSNDAMDAIDEYFK